LGQRPLGAVPRSPNELGELSEWLCHDDCTINIGICIIIIIIITAGKRLNYRHETFGIDRQWLTSLAYWFLAK